MPHVCLSCVHSGGAELIAAGVMAWLAISDEREQAVCGILALVLVGLRVLFSVPVLVLAAARKTAPWPLRQAWWSVFVPLNLELLRWLPWTSAVHDGLPSEELMAATAGLSLSHGTSMLLLLGWFHSSGGAPSVATWLVLAVSILCLGCVGLRRTALLWQAPSGILVQGEAGKLDKVRNLETPGVIITLPGPRPCEISGSTAALSGSEIDREAVRLRALQRQRAAMVAMRAADGMQTAGGATDDDARELTESRVGRAVAVNAAARVTSSRVQRAAAANSAKRRLMDTDFDRMPRSQQFVNEFHVEDEEEVDPEEVEFHVEEEEEASQQEEVNQEAVSQQEGNEDKGKNPENLMEVEGANVASMEFAPSRVQRACAANTAKKVTQANLVQSRTERARSVNRMTKERMQADQAAAMQAAAVVEQWRPAGRRATVAAREEASAHPSAADDAPSSACKDNASSDCAAPSSPSAAAVPLPPNRWLNAANFSTEHRKRLERARRTNRVRRARENFAAAGDASGDAPGDALPPGDAPGLDPAV